MHHVQWKRIRDQSIRALSDLSLLAEKSPNNKLRQIFNENTIKDLLFAIFLIDRSESKLKERSADVQLAAEFVRIGIDVCMSEYEKWNKDNPESSKPTMDYLDKAVAICNEIGFKSRMNLMEKESNENKYKLICIWEETDRKNKDKFDQYILKEMKIDDDIPMTRINNKYTSFEKEWDLIEDIGDPSENGYLGKVIVNINPVENKGKIKFYNDKNEEIKIKNIVIKKYGSHTALWG